MKKLYRVYYRKCGEPSYAINKGSKHMLVLAGNKEKAGAVCLRVVGRGFYVSAVLLQEFYQEIT